MMFKKHIVSLLLIILTLGIVGMAAGCSQKPDESKYSNVVIKKGLTGSEVKADSEIQQKLCAMLTDEKLSKLAVNEEDTEEPKYGGEIFLVEYDCDGSHYSWICTEQNTFCKVSGTSDAAVKNYQAPSAITAEIQNILNAGK